MIVMHHLLDFQTRALQASHTKTEIPVMLLMVGDRGMWQLLHFSNAPDISEDLS